MNERNIDYMQEYINLCNSTRRYLNSSMQLLSTQDRRLYSLLSHYIFNDSDDEDNNNSNNSNNSNNNNNNNSNNNSLRSNDILSESKSDDDEDDDGGNEIITQNLTRNQRLNLANSNTTTSYSRRSGINRRTSDNFSLPRVMNSRLRPNRLRPLRRTTLNRPSNLNATSNTPNTNTSTHTTTRRRTNTLARRDPSYHYPRRNVSNTTRRLSDILYNFYENNPITTFANLTPVIVRPTREQIENATQRVMYSTIEEPYNVTCPITQLTFGDDEYVTQILHCRHIFTTASLNQWFMSNVRCPVCRYDIREYNPLSEIRNPYRNTNTTTNSSTQNNDASLNDTSANDTSSNDTSSNDTSANDTSSNDTSANDTSSNDTSADDLYDTSSNINQILETFNENRIRFEENIQNTIENSISNNGLNQDVFIEYTYFFPTSTSSLDNSLNTSNDQSGNILDV